MHSPPILNGESGPSRRPQPCTACTLGYVPLLPGSLKSASVTVKPVNPAARVALSDCPQKAEDNFKGTVLMPLGKVLMPDVCIPIKC